ncbi:MAG: VWA domain-containing protein [Vicinamibacterales bacterium]
MTITTHRGSEAPRTLSPTRLNRRPISGLTCVAALVAVLLATASVLDAQQRTEPPPVLKITSPVGRTGLSGAIRIVVRLDGEQPATPQRVEFYIDKLYLADDGDGPPYEAIWTDDNPFERREIAVRAQLPSGVVLTDTMVLEPLRVAEAVEVTSIALEASVVDGKGRFIRNLTASDFEVLENGVGQEIDLVSQRREPSLFVLLVDSSQSMALRYDAVRAAARQFLEPLHPEDVVVVAPFSRGVTAVTGPTRDHPTILDAISAIRPTGGTAILDSVKEVISRLTGEYERRAIVLITDGYDEHSTSAFDDTVAAAQNSSVTLYVVGLGGVAGISLKGEKLLARLAEQTGGHAWFPRDNRQLSAAYTATAEDVQHRYLMTYTPKNQRRDGTWRSITITTRTPGLRVRAREGYTAPMAPPIRASFEFTAVGTGEAAARLTPDDVEVVEDGIAQKVDTFHEVALPVTIMLALDTSGSMTRSAERAQEAARGFVMAMRPEDRIGMIMFADRAEYIHSPTERRDWSLQAIDAYKARGGTALYDALYDSLAQLSDAKGRRVVVVVTDGLDENAASNGPGSLRSWEDVLEKLQQTDAAVYAVGIGSRIDRRGLQEVADKSGGAAYFPSDVTTLAADYQRILDELRRRYVLGYESTNRTRDGKWRKVQIRSRPAEVTVRSRDGYFAPTQ